MANVKSAVLNRARVVISEAKINTTLAAFAGEPIMPAGENGIGSKASTN